MRTLFAIVLTASVMYGLTACGQQREVESKSSFAVANSNDGLRCRNVLVQTGRQRMDQGFTLLSDGQNSTAENMHNPSNLAMTVSEFQAFCAKYDLYP